MRTFDITVPVFYSNLALRDRLVEEPFERTNALLRSGEGKVAVSSGLEIVMYAWSQQTAFIQLRTWPAAPGREDTDSRFTYSDVLPLECPTADIYIESAPDPSKDLPDALPDGPGIYAALIGRRRIPRGDPTGADVTADEPHDGQYTINLWRTGALSPQWLELLADDDD